MLPLPGVAVEAREQPRVGRHGHAARRARRQLDALEPEQAHALVASGLGEIELGHVGPVALAGVGHGEASP